MIDQTAVFGQFKGRVLSADGLIYAAWLAVSDFMVDMFHATNIAKLGYRWQPSTSSHQFASLKLRLGHLARRACSRLTGTCGSGGALRTGK